MIKDEIYALHDAFNQLQPYECTSTNLTIVDEREKAIRRGQMPPETPLVPVKPSGQLIFPKQGH